MTHHNDLLYRSLVDLVIKKQIASAEFAFRTCILNNYIPLQCAGDNSTNHNKCVKQRLTKSADLQGANTNTRIQMSSSIRVVDCFGLAPVEQHKCLVGKHQTAHYWANAGVLLGERMRRGLLLKQINCRDEVREKSDC